MVIVPALSVPLVYAIGRRAGGKKAGWLTFLVLAYVTALLLNVGLEIQDGGVWHEVYHWAPMIALKFGLLVDGLSLPIILTVSLLCTLIAIYSIHYMERRIYEEYHRPNNPAHATYYALYLLYSIGMMGTALATNLIEFYLFYELMLIPSWALINSFGYGKREKIGLMYLLWTHTGAVLLLMGILTAYTHLGSFEIADLARLGGDPIAIWIVLAMLLGFFIKMAVFGVHIWLPYAHAEAPTPISALLSPVMIGLGAYASVRIVVLPLYEVFKGFSTILAVLALITIVYGGLMVLAQDDIKRLLAYSSISQMGYLLTGIAYVTTEGIAGAMFHYFSHALGKGILFAVAGILIYQTNGIRSIRKLGGLASKMPITATVFIIGFLTIAGMPPTVGFQSKWPIFLGAVEGSISLGSPKLILAIMTLFATTITVAYALYTIWRVFFGQLPKHLEDVREAPLIMIIPLLVLTTLSLVLGLYPGLATDILVPFIGNQLTGASSQGVPLSLFMRH